MLETLTVKNKTFKRVMPYGKLSTEGKDYYLLSPFPVKSDWENPYLLRFVVVPMDTIDMQGNERLFSYARHLVVGVNNFVLEYIFVDVGKGIYIWQLPAEYDTLIAKYLTPDPPANFEDTKSVIPNPPVNFEDAK